MEISNMENKQIIAETKCMLNLTMLECHLTVRL